MATAKRKPKPSIKVPTPFEGDGRFRFDPAVAIAHLRQSDAMLARLIDTVGPFRMELRPTSNLFAALARAIAYQQLHGRAAATIFARVEALFPPGQGLAPEAMTHIGDGKLRGAGLSQNKLLALRDLAQKAIDGTIPTLAETFAMSDEEIIERLVAVRGIGRWSAEMLLMFALGRPDVWPIDDFGIRAGFARTFKKPNPTKDALLKRAERWRPYRSVASWYLWRAAERAPRTAASARPIRQR
jgi:3-methyladenine DNA glycosylase/8-oxoguanine DNA glycosylase